MSPPATNTPSLEEVWAEQSFYSLAKGPDPKTAEISGNAPSMSESFGSVLSGTNKIIVMGLTIFWVRLI